MHLVRTQNFGVRNVSFSENFAYAEYVLDIWCSVRYRLERTLFMKKGHPSRPPHLVTFTAEIVRRRSGVFIVNFECISHLFLVFVFFTLNKPILAVQLVFYFVFCVLLYFVFLIKWLQCHFMS